MRLITEYKEVKETMKVKVNKKARAKMRKLINKNFVSKKKNQERFVILQLEEK